MSVLSLSPARLTTAKRAFSTRRANAGAMKNLLKGPLQPRPGDLVLAQIEALGQHKRLQLSNGRPAQLFENDTVIVAYGHRYAPDQFEAEVPPNLGACHLAAAGGLAAQVLSQHGAMLPPTRLQPLGLIGDGRGQPLNLRDFALPSIATNVVVPVLAMVTRARMAAWIRLLPEAGGGLVTATIVLLGAWDLARGAVTPGTLVASLAVAGLLQPHLNALARVYDYWQNCRAAREYLRAFLALPSLEHPRRTAILTANAGRLRFDGLTVDGVLDDIRAEAEPGSLIVVAGGNGSGKSTLLAAAAGLLVPDAGRVAVDGQDLADCTLESIRRTVGIASPELPLLQGSFARNLSYRQPRATPDDLQELCRQCDLEDTIANLPKGLKTRIGEGGHKLPPGVRQRLMLARALLGNPSILVLDEVDTGLDDAGQHMLERILQQRRATTLLVTRNPRYLLLADSIWRLDGGRLSVLKGGAIPAIAECAGL